MSTSTNNSTTLSYTPLETVLLFRGLGHYGLEASAFARISDTLKTNHLVKNGSTYDPRRLNPEALQDFFLRLLRDEIRLDSERIPGPDGPLSPASKKRRLDAVPTPTLRDAPRYMEKIELAFAKYHEAYLRHAIQQIRDDERRYDQVQADIEKLERAELDEQNASAGNGEGKAQQANGAQNGAKQPESAPVNGVGPSSKPSPKPSPRIPVQHPHAQQQQQQTPTPQPLHQPQLPQLPQQQQQPQQVPQPQAVQQHPQQPVHQQPNQPYPSQQHLRPLQPLLLQLAPAPAPAPGPDSRSGSTPHPPQQVERPGAGPRPPALNHPQTTHSPQVGNQDLSRTAATRPPEPPKPPTTAPQVLQAPQGISTFQPISQASPAATADGLQRPEGVARAQQSPVPPPTHPQIGSPQPGSQSQLKWEPPYQPGSGPRPLSNPHQQHGQSVFSPPPHMMSSQRPPQIPSPLQAQPNRPLPPPQVMIPPQHATDQSVLILQPAPVRPGQDVGGVSTPSRQQPPVSSPGSKTIQSPFHPGPYNSSLSTQVHPPQLPAVHTGHAAQHGPAIHHGPVRSPAAGSPTVPPRPGQGLVAPSQQRSQLLSSLQAPPSYSQPAPPPPVPALASAQHDPPRVYNSPYQAPRTNTVERAPPRLPITSTPGTPARFGPSTAAPQTPTAVQPSFTVSAKITKWKTASTPSTPRPGVEFRLGWDDVPSPAFEPNSPILKSAPAPAAVQAAAKAPIPRVAPQEEIKKPPQTTTEPTETPSSKRKAGKTRTTQPARDTASPSPTTSSREESRGKDAEKAPEHVAEPEAPKVKVEVTTPRPTTEAGDTTADESVAGRVHRGRPTKRKRDDLTPTPIHTPKDRQTTDVPREESVLHNLPNVVLWTRHFNKVSGSAMEQIVHHRSANMFAQPIREKDAPGYNKVIKQPQDLKSIRAAINHGNRAAAQAAAALPGGDPQSSCWLPRTGELVPPKSIINSGQLDRELAHIFANAIMYNPDPFHGPGPAFSPQADNAEGVDGGIHQDNALGYKVDEFGVVNDARAMYLEVEKLLSELRSAEKRNAPPGGHMDGVATGTSTRQASVTVHGDGGKDDNATSFEDQDEQTATETENNDGRSKRRRIGRA